MNETICYTSIFFWLNLFLYFENLILKNSNLKFVENFVLEEGGCVDVVFSNRLNYAIIRQKTDADFGRGM